MSARGNRLRGIPVVWVLDIVTREGRTVSRHLSGPEPYGRCWKHHHTFKSYEYQLRHGSYTSVELKAVRLGCDGTEPGSLVYRKVGRLD